MLIPCCRDAAVCVSHSLVELLRFGPWSQAQDQPTPGLFSFDETCSYLARMGYFLLCTTLWAEFPTVYILGLSAYGPPILHRATSSFSKEEIWESTSSSHPQPLKLRDLSLRIGNVAKAETENLGVTVKKGASSPWRLAEISQWVKNFSTTNKTHCKDCLYRDKIPF